MNQTSHQIPNQTRSNRPASTEIPGSRGDTMRRVAFIQSCWHREIVDQCRQSFLKESAALGHTEQQIDLFEVPGAFEIPLQAQMLAKTGSYAAIVASGLVVNGGIYRHEFVASAVIDALMRVQLDTGIPVISAVLTPQNFHEHEVHVEFFHRHFVVKGVEAARACWATVGNLDWLRRASAV